MNRLVGRAIEEFIKNNYGDALWQKAVNPSYAPAHDVARIAGLETLATAACLLNKPGAELSEDFGAWLARLEPVRRLLRFSGRDFIDFLLSLEELPDRVRLIAVGLAFPKLRVFRVSGQFVTLTVEESTTAWTPVLAGVVRTMADDFGALGLIQSIGFQVHVQVLDDSFSSGRDFRICGSEATVS
ncbi:heme NO-binding domain-containing protein [Paracoccus sp. (in: a-proteobacteria)]|uniref:heme NO-binding domain-containing protein n=1 Tax=Paracoccus sp. TaxID=267 RepID=UPI0026E0343E|nr:heme NO-binding domain-containing protein [Paracoccus sp. (in: a-proteobacteria)]MDO5646375.1 heme NO-binding domain-containing protein [Paracoccus sp. (in: a-proteobacteria)]